MPHEVPPTAGLPLKWSDLIGLGSEPDLGRALATFLGVESVGVTCSGTASLIVALETLKRRSVRRTVVIPAYTCPLVPLAVAYVGLEVKVCDLSPNRFDFDPDGGRELFYYYGSHLGSGVGTAAGVKLARPNQQVICLVGDGSFIFGPTALWNMARLELPVIVVVYNNHAYAGPHSRVVANVPGGRMVETGQFVHDFLGNPDMNMADIARGFGVAGEVVDNPKALREALARARAHTVEGKPYLLDVQVARRGVGWSDKPWVPPIRVAGMRQKRV